MNTSNIGLWPFIISGGLLGVASSLYVIVSLFATIIYKIYRKMCYNEKIF